MNKTIKFFVFATLALALLTAVASPNLLTVKGQTQGAIFVYTSVGGTISQSGTNLEGDSTYNFPVGQAVSFTANPQTDFNFLGWVYATSTGVNTSTANPLVYNVTSQECAVQAMFVPSMNITLTTPTGSGSSPFVLPMSLGGTTSPASGQTYTNYNVGDTVNLKATPSSGFKFMYWLVPTADGNQLSIVTSDSFDFKVPSNACAAQAFFAPTDSNIQLPSIPTIPEFGIVALFAILGLVTVGTLVAKKRKS